MAKSTARDQRIAMFVKAANPKPTFNPAGSGLGRLPREDDPNWNASTMGNRTGWYKGTYYSNGKPTGRRR